MSVSGSFFTRQHGVALLAIGLLSACGEKSPGNQGLVLPQRPDGAYVTDQASIAGIHLSLWDDGQGVCKLQVGKADQEILLKPKPPCHFIHSPGSGVAQVFQQDKTTRVFAVEGSPLDQPRCGQEVQGMILKGGKITLSGYLMQGKVYCADQGLQNAQYTLFTRKNSLIPPAQ